MKKPVCYLHTSTEAHHLHQPLHNNTNLQDLIKEIDSTKHHLKILVGDFDFPSISWKDLHCNSSNLEANTFKQTVLDCYMTQHIDFPTRARGTDNLSYLDYIFTNSEELINNVLDTSTLGNSDHTVIQADINVRVTKQKPFKKYYYDKGDYNNMRTYVKERMDQAPDTEDINHQWNYFMDTLKEAQDKFVPSKVITSSGKRKRHQGTAFDSNVIRKIKKKHRCWQRYMETKSGEKYVEYRKLSNQVKKLTKKPKRNWKKGLPRKPNQTRKSSGTMLIKNKKTSMRQGIPDLVYEENDGNEKSTASDTEKADVLSEFFSSVFTKEDTSKIPTLPKREFKQWLAHITVSKENIKKRLMQLKISKAPGPDQIHPCLLKELSEEISLPLEIIFNQSLKQGCLPKIWIVGEISAIFKKGNRRVAGNYRPVSLTSIICKTLESGKRVKKLETPVKHKANASDLTDLRKTFLEELDDKATAEDLKNMQSVINESTKKIVTDTQAAMTKKTETNINNAITELQREDHPTHGR